MAQSVEFVKTVIIDKNIWINIVKIDKDEKEYTGETGYGTWQVKFTLSVDKYI